MNIPVRYTQNLIKCSWLLRYFSLLGGPFISKRLSAYRTYNSPVGDYAEWIVSTKLNLLLEKNSKKGYDAIDDASGIRYQIKSRWMHPGKNSRELNVIRNYEEKQFDYLIAVIFGNDFEVAEAYKVPHDVIGEYFLYKEHQNGVVVTLGSNFIQDTRGEDITYIFR